MAMVFLQAAALRVYDAEPISDDVTYATEQQIDSAHACQTGSISVAVYHKEQLTHCIAIASCAC
eukprot:4446519-Alexandrium_andersonii.AAC.1